MRGLRGLLDLALLLAAIALAAWLSVRWQVQVDLSRGERASLTAASREVLARLEGPVEVISYAREGAGLREVIAAFVLRYTRLKPDLGLRFVNPDSDPGAMRELGVAVDGELELVHQGRRQRLTRLDERSFTQALSRLARPQARVVGSLTGPGERRVDGEANPDLGRFARAMADQGVRMLPVDLARQAGIPANIDLLLLAGPGADLAEGELAQLVAYVERGGSLLWLAEPGPDRGLAPLARALGVQLLPGTLVDATAQEMGIGDPSFVATTRFPAHASTRDFALTVLLPQAVALGAVGGARFAAAPLLRTGERSWTESGAIQGGIAYDAGSGELPGPHDMALALTRLSPRPDRDEQRVVVVGDGDFLSNAYLGNGGNRDLGMRLVNWLVGDDALVKVEPMLAPDRELALGELGLAFIGFGFLLGLPLLLLATGGLIAWRRRRG